MANRIVSVTTLTLTAFADTTNLTDATYPFILQGGTSTQRSDILEIYWGGQSTSSATAFMVLGRDSQVATGSNTNGTGQNDAALDPSTAALAAPALTGNSNATNKPQRSSTLKLLNLSGNAYGGVVRWVAPPAPYGPTVLGNTASLGEVSFSSFTGGSGIIGAHMIYSTY